MKLKAFYLKSGNQVINLNGIGSGVHFLAVENQAVSKKIIIL